MNRVFISLEQTAKNPSEVISRVLSGIDNNTEVVFEKGEYYIDRPITVKNLKNTVIDGNGATLVAHFDRKAYYQNSTSVFDIDGCEELILRDFVVDSDVPTNVAGEIVRYDGKTVDVQLNPSLPLDGDEMFISSMTFKDDMTPARGSFVSARPDPTRRTLIAGEIPCTNPEKLNTPHEMIGDQLFRIYPYVIEGDMTQKKCNISHSYYGLVAVVFHNSCDVTVEDFEIVNYGGFGFAIMPRCRDFTFRRLRIASKDPEHQPFAINSDGIHVTGLMGKLTVEDCYFEQLGDDCINLHTHVMAVTEVDDDRLHLIYDKVGGKIPPQWGQKGDILRVYDPDSLQLKGRLTILSCSEGWVAFDKIDFVLRVGDLITNEVYFPEVDIKRVTAKNCRARPFVIQSTDRCRISDCDFYGCGPAVYISTAFKVWLEAGPAKNVEIVGNRFHSTYDHRGGSMGSIFIRVAEDPELKYQHIHENIVIRDNTFDELPYYAVWVYACDSVTIEGNTFNNCNNGEGDLHILNCTKVTVEGNRSFKDGVEVPVIIRDDR